MQGIDFRRIIQVFILLASVPLAVSAETLHIGSTSSKPVREIKKFLPLATYLGSRLQAEGFSRAQVVVGRNLQETAKLLRDRKIDLYIDSPFPSLAVGYLSGSKLFLRRWKKGMAEYHAVIFARKDSGIVRMEDLKQRTLAFEASYSSSGYFLPKMVLLQHGLKLMRMEDLSVPVAWGKIGYVFSGEDENTLVWVQRNKVSAGVLDNLDFEKTVKEHPATLQVIHRTFSIPRHIVSHRASLPLPLAASIREILVRMDQSEEGKKALRDFEGTTKFDEIPASAMAPLLKDWDLIKAEVAK